MVENASLASIDAPNLPDPYELVSISAVSAPAGMPGDNWHRYEICQGGNTIVGYRSGTAAVVRDAVEKIVVDLNVRRTMRRGRVHVILHSGSKRVLQ